MYWAILNNSTPRSFYFYFQNIIFDCWPGHCDRFISRHFMSWIVLYHWCVPMLCCVVSMGPPFLSIVAIVERSNGDLLLMCSYVSVSVHMLLRALCSLGRHWSEVLILAMSMVWVVLVCLLVLPASTNICYLFDLLLNKQCGMICICSLHLILYCGSYYCTFI